MLRKGLNWKLICKDHRYESFIKLPTIRETISHTLTLISNKGQSLLSVIIYPSTGYSTATATTNKIHKKKSKTQNLCDLAVKCEFEWKPLTQAEQTEQTVSEAQTQSKPRQRVFK